MDILWISYGSGNRNLGFLRLCHLEHPLVYIRMCTKSAYVKGHAFWTEYSISCLISYISCILYLNLFNGFHHIFNGLQYTTVSDDIFIFNGHLRNITMALRCVAGHRPGTRTAVLQDRSGSWIQSRLEKNTMSWWCTGWCYTD